MACDVPHLCQFIPIQAEVNFNTVFSSNYCPVSAFMKKRQPYPTIKWDKVFKNRPSKICGRQPLKNLKGYGTIQSTILFPWMNDRFRLMVPNSKVFVKFRFTGPAQFKTSCIQSNVLPLQVFSRFVCIHLLKKFFVEHFIFCSVCK